jgi:hypothetical protein
MKAEKATVDAEDNRGESVESGSADDLISSIYFKEQPGELPFNASEVVSLGDSRFLFCDNNISDAAFEMRFKPDGELLPLIRHPIRGVHPRAIDDLECMAMAEVDGQRLLFLSSSLCLKQKDVSARKKSQRGKLSAARESLIRVKIAPDGRSEAEIIPCFRYWLIENSPVLGRTPDFLPDDGGLNIEGLAWDSTQNALVFGLRGPTKSGRPILLRVKIKDPTGLWNLSNLESLEPVTLSIEDADGRFGVRAIDYDPERNSYLIVVGNSVSGTKTPFFLYSRDGNMQGIVKKFKRISFHKKMRPEGVTHGTIGGRGAIVFVDDRGGYQFVWNDDPRLELDD